MSRALVVSVNKKMKWMELNSALEIAKQSGDRLELGTRKKEESVMTPLLAPPTGRQVLRREDQGRAGEETKNAANSSSSGSPSRRRRFLPPL